MKRIVFSVVGAAFVLASSAAASPSAVAVRGVVVGKQQGRLLVASPRGLVRLVSGRASIGSRVLVRSGRVVGLTGRAHTARIRGVVVRRSGKLTFLSAGRHLLVVHAGRRLASVQDTAPAPGTVVQQTVSFGDQGNLDDQGEHQLGQSSQVQIQATVQAVGTGTVTLVITDANNQQQTLTIPLPAGLTLPTTLVGTQVTLSVSFANGQPTASEQGNNQQGNDEQGDSQNGQQGDDEQGDNENNQQGGQTTTADQQTTSGSQDGGSGGSGD